MKRLSLNHGLERDRGECESCCVGAMLLEGRRGGGMWEREPAGACLNEQLFLEAAAGGHHAIPFMHFLELPKLFHVLWQ